jgi:cysteine desulfurase
MQIKGIKQALKKANEKALLHCDGVQAFGKIPINIEGLGIDLLTISGHKLHAPKGVGALYIKKGTRILPTLFGGGQEVGLRSGTENTSGIAGFGEAVKIKFTHFNNDNEKIKGLKEYLLQKLEELKPDIVMNSPTESIPHIINFSVLGIRSEILLHFLESKGVFVSSGSACSSSKGISYVLKEMKLPQNVADSAIRVSFSSFNTKEEIDFFFEKLIEARKEILK